MTIFSFSTQTRCVDTIKLSTHSQLANDLEINKAVRCFIIIVNDIPVSQE